MSAIAVPSWSAYLWMLFELLVKVAIEEADFRFIL
jgi:hypothetical protein